jgi:hypothetical protein
VGRFCEPWLVTSRVFLNQRSNQAQEFLLFWSVPSCDEKGSNLNIGALSTGGEIRFMSDEHPIGIRIAGQQPPVPVGTAINLSGPNGHAKFAPSPP